MGNSNIRKGLLNLYIVDTFKGFHVIIEDITDTVVKARTDLPDSRSKLSIIRYTNSGRPYFIKEKTRIYLDNLNTEYFIE